MPDHPAATVLIVNYNAGGYLAEVVAALRAQTLTAFEAIVLDNGSRDASLAEARAAVEGDPRFRFVEAGANLGFAAGNNRAADLATAPLLAFLNPDAVPDPDWLERLVAAATAHPEVALFGSTQLSYHDEAVLDGAGDRYLFLGLPWRGGFGWPAATAGASPHRVFGPCAAASLIRTDLFRRLEGFEERFFCYIEDVDLAFRARLAGATCLQIPTARVRHVGGASSGGGTSDFARYHGIRNLSWCFVRNMPGPLFWPLLPLHLLTLLALLALALRRGQARIVARALHDAVRSLPTTWRDRRRIQSARSASWLDLARALDWNLGAYRHRAPATPDAG